MLKGIVIFGAGTAFGYAVAMNNQEANVEVKKAAVDFINSLKAISNDAWLDTKNEAKAAKEKVEDTAKESDSPIIVDANAEAVSPDSPPEPEITREGE
jgi:hypothetical protein